VVVVGCRGAERRHDRVVVRRIAGRILGTLRIRIRDVDERRKPHLHARPATITNHEENAP
jgi:hypothetical protein